MNINKRIGEVVESSSLQFTVQCYDLYKSPNIGTLVKCGSDPQLFGIVYDVSNKSMDPARRPVPRGRNENKEEEVYLSNPQLNRLLITEVNCVLVGYQSVDEINQSPVSLPPRIHSFVIECSDEELKRFSSCLDFLPLLLESPVLNSIDEVISSFLIKSSRVHDDSSRFLIYAGKELAFNLSGQLIRLNNLLKRISK
mgnify:CR=1 FL=1|tara:strand:- start:1768 stop:2358 length:591 start_codon:yes stop_codon:yes gene_type:complete